MTKSTGKRAARKRREELLRAELKIERVMLHLLDAMRLVRMCGADRAFDGYVSAFDEVIDRWDSVKKEQKKLEASA